MFDSNSAVDRGGAVAVTGAVTLVATNVSFSSNSALSGGAVAVSSDSAAQLDGCEFTYNSAARGGALEVFDSSETGGGRVTLLSAIFQANTAFIGAAVLLNANNVDTITFNASSFSGNRAQYFGGTFAITATARWLVLVDCAYDNNFAGIGGGVYFINQTSNTTSNVVRGPAAAPTCATCAFTNNTSGSYGDMSATLPTALVASVPARMGTAELLDLNVTLQDSFGQLVQYLNPGDRVVASLPGEASSADAALLGVTSAPIENGAARFTLLRLLGEPSAQPYTVALEAQIGSGIGQLVVPIAIQIVLDACPELQAYDPQGKTCVCDSAANAKDLGDSCSCDAGSFMKLTAGSSPVCALCPPGTYSSQANTQTSCTPCASGTVASSAGATGCSPCPSFSLRLNATSCACQPGYQGLLEGAAGQCTACPLSTYQPRPDLPRSLCLDCPLNSRTISTAAITLDTCMCDAGWYMAGGDGACALVPAGAFTAGRNRGNYSECDFSSISERELGSTACKACPANSGRSSPTACACKACARQGKRLK